MAESTHHRIMSIVIALSGHEVHGLRNGELVEATGANRGTISRDLDELQRIGIAEEIPNLPGRWRLGPKIIQIARAHTEGMARVRAAVTEIDQRYTRNPL